MKKLISFITILLLAASPLFAQSKVTWPELKAFHHYMSGTFHPAEEGNLAPLKAQADSMLVSAKQWQASAIPDQFKPAETKAALEKLVQQCSLINTAVQAKEPDDKLLKLITDAHDIFHTIVGECRKPE